MRITVCPLLAISILAVTPCAIAQTFKSLPSGYDTLEGDNNNTIPFWSESGVYQQVHDDVDMRAVNNGGPIIMLGLGFRKDSGIGSSTAARTMDVQLTVGVSPFSSQTASTDFATNLGPNPTVVLQYTQVNIPALLNISVPNPVAFVMPFSAPYPFAAAAGNHFIWEMRHRNSTSSAIMAMDAVSGTSVQVSMLGRGCVATGQTQPAAITTRSWNLTSGDYRNKLDRAAVNTPTAFFLGAVPAPISLPGLCSQLEFAPLATVNGITDAVGTWDLIISTGINFVGYPSATLLGQFVFFDAGLPLGLGLSDATRMTSPLASASMVTRLYNAPYNGLSGFETSTNATGTGRGYGLVALIQTP